MKNFYLHYREFLDKIVLLVVVVAVLLALVFFMGYIAPFVAGYVISLILSPLVGLIERKFAINRGVVTAVVILLGLGVLFAFVTLIISRLVTEMTALVADIPFYIESLQNTFAGLRERILNAFGSAGSALEFDALFAGFLSFVTALLQGFIEGGNFITAIPGAIFRVILTIISAFFFIKDKELIKSSVSKLLPEKMAARGRQVRLSLLEALAGYGKGQLVIMCAVGTICIMGLTVLGSPYSLFIGIGIAVFDVLPVLGSGVILVPWSIYSFLNGDTTMGTGLLIIWALCFICRQILEPRVVGRRIGLHPLMLLMSIYLGITIIGPAGFLLGPLMVLVVKSVIQTAHR